jgi:hypothetical protein
MKVGDKVWLFSSNKRVYPKGKGISCAPIYSEHFYQDTIEGETSRSWVIGKHKYPKNGGYPRFYTDEQKQDAIWDNENRRKIIDKINNCPTDMLKQIDTLLTNTPTGRRK